MSANRDKDAWRKHAVKRERIHEPLVTQLCSSKGKGSPIFTYNKDLMVFAAMVGHALGKRKTLDNDTISIILETYASDQKDAFIYLIALMEEKNATILKDNNLTSAIKVFEEYCNTGLYEIKLWLDENPGDHEGTDTLANKIFEKIIENEKQSNANISPDAIEITF